MNRDTALDYLCSLEEEFLARADREAESELNESFKEEEAYYDDIQDYGFEEEEEKYDEPSTPEFYDGL